jgi:hypothetical protein
MVKSNQSTTKSTADFINEQIANSDEIKNLHDRIGEMETVFLSVMWLIVDVIPAAYAEDVQAIIDDFHGYEDE